MKRLTTVLVGLVSMISTPTLAAEPYIIMATEAQLVEYDQKLEQYFSIPPLSNHPKKYLSYSKNLRRVNGQSTCSMLTAYSVKEYLDLHVQKRIELYTQGYIHDRKNLSEDISYPLGVTVAAVETICPEHKTELEEYLIDFAKTAE